jgi:hypothetical protein
LVVDAPFEAAWQWDFLDKLQGLRLLLSLSQRQTAQPREKNEGIQKI